jgi:hypothetical protein
MSYTRVKNISVPQRVYRSRSKYPYAELEINEAFLVPIDVKHNESADRVLKRMYAASSNFMKGNPGTRFKAYIDDNYPNAVVVVRLS